WVVQAMLRAGQGGEPDRRLRLLLGAALAAGVLAGATLWIAGRRAPAAGALCGMLTVAVWFTVIRLRGHARWIVAAPLAVAVGAGGFVWVQRQMRSQVTEISGPVAVRLIYWREALGCIADAPLLGHGPDGFTTVVTPR